MIVYPMIENTFSDIINNLISSDGGYAFILPSEIAKVVNMIRKVG